MRICSLTVKRAFVTFCTFLIILLGCGVCFGQPSCRFTQASSTLPFGNLDPSSTANATTSVNIGIRCAVDPWFLSSDNGLYPSGSTKRMRHQTVLTEYLPYSLTFSPTTGNRFVRTITGSGTILNSNYINACVGSYSDTVTLTIMP